MKKRIFTMLMVVAMVATMFVGCGDANDTNTETTNDNNTEVVENTEGINLIPETEEEEVFSSEFAWKFPTGMEGFTNKSIYASDETWSSNGTHYVDTHGNIMNFKWEGPTELGESASAGERTLVLSDKNENYIIHAWTGGYEDGDYEKCVDMDKTTWTSFAETEIPYLVDGYYNVDISDTTIKVIFEVEGRGYKGYNYYITDASNYICYQFAYLEKADIYDDERALEVIKSLDFWDMEIVE